MPRKTTQNKALSRTFTSQYTYTPPKPKKFFEPSQTQPDMAHSIKDIMSRAEQGLPIPSSAELAQYGDDPDFIGLEPNMDLVEKHQIMADAKRELKQKEHEKKGGFVSSTETKEVSKPHETETTKQKSGASEPKTVDND